MEKQGLLTKFDLFRAALHKLLRETLLLIPFFFAVLFIWEAVVMHDRNTGRLLLFSACVAAALWLFVAAIICCSTAGSLLLLRYQEKCLGFTFEEEGLTKIKPNDKWYLYCGGARVLAIRRGFIRRAWKPQRIGNYLWKMRIEDINGKCHSVKAHLSDIEKLMDWLNDGKGKTEHRSA